MTAKARLLTLLLLILALPALAKEEVFTTPYYRLRIHPDARVVERVDTGFETLLTVELGGQRARIRWKAEGFTVIFPTSTLRLSTATTSDGYKLTTDFAGQRYLVTKTAREVGWVLPGQDVFFRTWGGAVSGAVGSSDYLNLTRDSKGGRILVESQAGTSDLLLKKGGASLEVFDGPELASHLYFVRGLAFHQGPITLQIPLPSERFFNALPPDRYLLVEGPAAPVSPAATDEASTTPGDGAVDAGGNLKNDVDPLRAEPSSWEAPLKANVGAKKDDPLRARREERVEHPENPLTAKPPGDSEEILRVKDY